MSRPVIPIPEQHRPATDAVAEYVLLSIGPDHLRWTIDVNLSVAEFVWNAGGENLDPKAFHAPGPDLAPLVEELAQARRTRWPDLDFLLFDLRARTENGEIVLEFTLSFDDGEVFEDFEITIDWGREPHSERN